MIMNLFIYLSSHSPNKRSFRGPNGVVRGLGFVNGPRSVRGSWPLWPPGLPTWPPVASRCLLCPPAVSPFCC